MRLQRDISKWSLLFTSVGGIVGSGWLFGPFYAAKLAGPAAVLTWLVGGLLMTVIALTFAELSSSFPEAGGIARFAHLSHGYFTSFTLAWISWLAALMVAPIETMAALQYAANYWPQLVVSNTTHVQLSSLGLLMAASLMLLLSAINCYGVKLFAKSNFYLVLWKLIIPIITIAILFHERFDVSKFTAYGGFMPMGWQGLLHALPAAGVIFSFIGYSPAIQLAGEAKEPQKAIPFAILGAIFIAIILYVVLQIAFIGVLDGSHLVHGYAGLSFHGDAGPIAGILTAFGLLWFIKIIYADAIISPLGTAFIYTASTARLNIAMANNQYMPQSMLDLNKHAVPVKAIALNFMVGLLFFLPFPGWQAMVSFLVSCFVLAYAIGPIACCVLRNTQADVPRPFKLPCHKIICLIAFYICNLIVYWTGWDVIWKMLVTILLGYVVLLIQWVPKRKQVNLNIKQGWWLLPYLVGLGLCSYFGSFGGIGSISFGFDFIVLAIFSMIIFRFATRNA